MNSGPDTKFMSFSSGSRVADPPFRALLRIQIQHLVLMLIRISGVIKP